MENNIVQDFQNLRVFSNHNTNRMDELVHDLSLALEETAKCGPRAGNCHENAVTSGAVTRRYHKRRRGARRAAASLYRKRGFISEASESSVDEVVRVTIDSRVVTHSDSDDLSLAYPKQRLSVPATEPVPPIESDSFTENLSPLRPQRRRRRYKHMAVDAFNAMGQPDGGGDGLLKGRSAPTMLSAEHKRTSHHIHTVAGSSRGGLRTIVPGKRKRCSKSLSDVIVPEDQRLGEDKDLDQDSMDMGSVSQESSLSSSEFDSDIYNNADEGREGDDEQSDFFHEPDGVCGIPEMIPCWETKDMMDESLGTGNKEFDVILSGALSHMPVASQKSFRRRVDKIIARAESGREIRIGRRKLTENMPRYTMMRFLQDRERWNSMQSSNPGGSHFNLSASWNSGYSSQSGDYKRLRQTPPPPLDPTDESSLGFITLEGSSVAVASADLDKQMLQPLGWVTKPEPEPDRDLQLGPIVAFRPEPGPHHDLQLDPVVAFRRRGRKGLGYETQSDT